jgi:YD repeat-containing protein
LNTNYGLIVPWWHGKEFRTETFDTDGATMLRILESTWAQRSPSWCANMPLCSQNPSEQAPTNSPFVVETKSTLVDGNLVSKVSSVNPADGLWAFDTYNNQTGTWTYGYGVGQPGGLIQRTQTSYVNYHNLAAGMYLLGLTDTTNVYGYNYASQEILESCSQTIYDEYSSYPILTYGSVTGWQNPVSPRGNPTTVRRWLDSTGGWVETHAQFDQLGNACNTWDPMGHETQTSYADSFSDSVNRNTFAFATQVSSPVPDPTAQYGANYSLVSNNIYDYYTGLVTASSDANGQTTTFDYSDPLDRLKQVHSPDGGQTTYNYVDAHQCGAYVQTLTLIDTSGRQVSSYQFYDGLGRPYRSFVYENQDPNNAYITVDTQYDAMGRVYQISSPYRSNGCGAGINPSGKWTRTLYDALGRPTQVTTTADGASVTSSYTGNVVTVTDAANKQKKSISDSLGRITDVYEGSNDGNTNYLTSYTYDARGNLRRVNQGGQLRDFMYDSLGRLTRAKYPEQLAGSAVSGVGDQVTGNTQWSLGYNYDNDGNIISRIDARNITTSYAYDALNRNYSVSYTDGSPTIYRYFDSSVNGKGRLYWQQTVGVAAGTVDSYDAVGRVTQYKQRF